MHKIDKWRNTNWAVKSELNRSIQYIINEADEFTQWVPKDTNNAHTLDEQSTNRENISRKLKWYKWFLLLWKIEINDGKGDIGV